MWRSNAGDGDHRQSRTVLRGSSSVAGLMAMLLHGQELIAHSVLITRGEAVVHVDHIAIALEVIAEDFLHLYGIVPDADGRFSFRELGETARQYGEVLARTVSVHEMDGGRLKSQLVGFAPGWPNEGRVELGELRGLRARYEFHFANPTNSRYLTWRLTSLDDGIRLPLQVVITVSGEETIDPCVVRITSGGNAETVELRLSPTTGRVDGISRMETLKEISAEIVADEPRVRAVLWIPLTLLDTFVPLRSTGGALLTPLEQDQASAEILRLVSRSLAIYVDEEVLPVEEIEIAWVPLDPCAGNDAQDISLYSGRLRATLQFRNALSLRQIAIHWQLFNPAVLSAVATIERNGRSLFHRFSTYDDILSLPNS